RVLVQAVRLAAPEIVADQVGGDLEHVGTCVGLDVSQALLAQQAQVGFLEQLVGVLGVRQQAGQVAGQGGTILAEQCLDVRRYGIPGSFLRLHATHCNEPATANPPPRSAPGGGFRLPLRLTGMDREPYRVAGVQTRPENAGRGAFGMRTSLRFVALAMLFIVFVPYADAAAQSPASAGAAGWPEALTRERRFDIAPQPLDQGLKQFANQAGLQIMFSPELVEGRI